MKTTPDPDGWFSMETVRARLLEPSGEPADRYIQIRVNPISDRTSRITFSRVNEKEAGEDRLPSPPPDAQQTARCPFCRPQVLVRTPRLIPQIHPAGRMFRGESLLFPNLFPYGAYSAVSLFDNTHFVEIGTATERSYADCLVNCVDYLKRVSRHDPSAAYMAITQNHLPSAGGSMVHPHLQVHADQIGSNHHRFLFDRALAHKHSAQRGGCLVIMLRMKSVYEIDISVARGPGHGWRLLRRKGSTRFGPYVPGKPPCWRWTKANCTIWLPV